MNGRKRLNWDEYALALAYTASIRSEDPYRQVGASALFHDNTIAGLGYNGPPPGIDIDWSDREGRQKYIIHAERNCLAKVKPGECRLLACTTMPCMDCIREIALKKIPRVVFREVYLRNGIEPMYEEILRLALHFGVELAHLPQSI